MLRVTVLSSNSSDGNCVAIDNGTTKLLFDFGMKFKHFSEKAQERDIKLDDIDAVLITHAHGDHIDGLNSFIKVKGNNFIYTTANVMKDMAGVKKLTRFRADEAMELKLNEWMEVGSYKIRPRKMKHDGLGASRISECIGFEVFDTINNKYYMYATDTSTLKNISIPNDGFDLVMVECNHVRKYVDMHYFDGTPKSGMDYSRYVRTTKDHLSQEQLNDWVLENDINCYVLELHESPEKKPTGRVSDKYKEYKEWTEFFKENTNE